jgi:Domain of unknown function (DUF373).
MLSNYLAEIWGISLVIIPLALLMNQKLLRKLFAEVENEYTMLSWGAITLVIGLAMVLAHNIWTPSWQVVITIIGWLALLKGLAHLFLPDMAKKWLKKIENKQWLPIALVVAVFVGLVITYLGFTA